jgi:hypothetical protein
MNDELVRIWYETVAASFKIARLLQLSNGDREENQ